METGRTEKNFLTRDEARQLLRFSTSKLDAEIRAGRLRVHRFGRLVRINADDLANYIRESCEVKRPHGSGEETC